jgi:hypothetical protein
MKKNRLINLVFVALMFVALTLVTAHSASAQGEQPPEVTVGIAIPDLVALGNRVAERGVFLAIVVIGDLILGVTMAIRNKVFQWQRLADFLSDYGPKAVAWLVLECFSLLPADLAVLVGVGSAMALGAYSAILISGVGSVLANAQALRILPVELPGVAKLRG